MVNQTVITVGIYLRCGRPIRTVLGVQTNPTFGGSFAHVAPRRDHSPRVGKLANLGPEAAALANVGETWAKFRGNPDFRPKGVGGKALFAASATLTVNVYKRVGHGSKYRRIKLSINEMRCGSLLPPVARFRENENCG